MPLPLIALLASLFDETILFVDKISIIFIPLLISFLDIKISGKFSPIPPPKVSFAVFSAFVASFFPCNILVASFAKRVFKSFIFLVSFSFWEIVSNSISVNIFKNFFTFSS